MTPQADADAILVERVKQGDVRAFEMLVVKYQRRIERLIGRMVRDSDLVFDIAQETFIRAYRALPQFRGESAFYTWLYRIAVNTAKKALADLKRDPIITEAAIDYFWRQFLADPAVKQVFRAGQADTPIKPRPGDGAFFLDRPVLDRHQVEKPERLPLPCGFREDLNAPVDHAEVVQDQAHIEKPELPETPVALPA